MAKTPFLAKDGIASASDINLTKTSSALVGLNSAGDKLQMMSIQGVDHIIGDHNVNMQQVHIRAKNHIYHSPSADVSYKVFTEGNKPTSKDVVLVHDSDTTANALWANTYAIVNDNAHTPANYTTVINLSRDSEHGLQLAASYGSNDTSLYWRSRSANEGAPNGKGLQKWYRIYHTGYKPSAEDVKALPITGGTITGNLVLEGTAGVKLPTGTTAQRGTTTGQFRFNTDDNMFEGYNGTNWTAMRDKMYSSTCRVMPQVTANKTGWVKTTLTDDNRVDSDSSVKLVTAANHFVAPKSGFYTMHTHITFYNSLDTDGTISLYQGNVLLASVGLSSNGSQVAPPGTEAGKHEGATLSWSGYVEKGVNIAFWYYTNDENKQVVNTPWCGAFTALYHGNN